MRAWREVVILKTAFRKRGDIPTDNDTDINTNNLCRERKRNSGARGSDTLLTCVGTDNSVIIRPAYDVTGSVLRHSGFVSICGRYYLVKLCTSFRNLFIEQFNFCLCYWTRSAQKYLRRSTLKCIVMYFYTNKFIGIFFFIFHRSRVMATVSLDV